MSSEKIQLVKELHRTARKNFLRRRVIVKGLDDLWQADLVDMKAYSRVNKGHKYILTIIDVLSKYAWAIPVLTKSGKHVTQAFRKALKNNRVPKNLQTDDGKEFYNSEFKHLTNDYDINHYSTYSVMKASVVERLNRTLKEKMWRKFTLNGNYKWLALLPNIVKDYNNTIHSKTRMKPAQVGEKEAKKLLDTVYNNIKIAETGKFIVGDRVRISKYKHLFAKGYTPNWTTEVFKISRVKNTLPVTYELLDSTNTSISGSFYEQELQRVKNPDVYLVENVLKKRGDRVYVKWLGLDSKSNSWIAADNVL